MLSTRSLSPASGAARAAALALVGSGLLYVSAQIAIPANPVWGVPITLQTLAIPVLVALLGRGLATVAVVAYLVEGLCGLPVFQGHLGGIGRFIGPLASTAGYLVGFPVAAYAIGTLYRTPLGSTYPGRVAAILAGTSVVFLTGAAWLASAMGLGLARAVAVGVVPFIVGDVLKSLVAAALPPRTGR